MARDEAIKSIKHIEQKSASDLRDRKSYFEDLENQLREARQERDDALESARGDKIKAGKATANLSMAEKELKQYGTAMEDLEQQKASLTSQLKNAETREKELKNQLATGRVGDRIRQLLHQRCFLEKQRDDQAAQAAQAKVHNAELAKEIIRLSDTARAQANEIQELGGKTAQLEAELDEAKADNGAIAEHRATMARQITGSDDGEGWETAPIFDEEEGEGGEAEEAGGDSKQPTRKSTIRTLPKQSISILHESVSN